MNHLGPLYRELGRPKDALPLFEEAERIARRTLGEESPSTLSYKHNRALSCADLGRWDEALGHFSEVLAKRRKILGDRHLTTLKTECGIAGILQARAQGRESNPSEQGSSSMNWP
jgi:hypothetical protein